MHRKGGVVSRCCRGMQASGTCASNGYSGGAAAAAMVTAADRVGLRSCAARRGRDGQKATGTRSDASAEVLGFYPSWTLAANTSTVAVSTARTYAPRLCMYIGEVARAEPRHQQVSRNELIGNVRTLHSVGSTAVELNR